MYISSAALIITLPAMLQDKREQSWRSPDSVNSFFYVICFRLYHIIQSSIFSERLERASLFFEDMLKRVNRSPHEERFLKVFTAMACLGGSPESVATPQVRGTAVCSGIISVEKKTTESARYRHARLPWPYCCSAETTRSTAAATAGDTATAVIIALLFSSRISQLTCSSEFMLRFSVPG